MLFLWTSPSRRRHVTVVNLSIITNTYSGLPGIRRFVADFSTPPSADADDEIGYSGLHGNRRIIADSLTPPSADVNHAHGIDVVTFTSSLSAN